MPLADVEATLLAAARLGLADGQRAFILMDTWTSLNASSQLTMSTPLRLDNSSGNVHLMTNAAQALLIVKAHAVSLASVSDISYKVNSSYCNTLAALNG